MTARQLDYIKSLVQQKDTTGLTVEQLTFLGRIVVAPLDGYTFEAASRTITALVALPNRDGTPVVAPTTTRVPDVSAGRYALVADDGTIKFYSVDKPTDGKWAGRTFVNAMGSDTRYPIRNRDEKNRIMRMLAKAPEAAMRLYAMELGRCAYCGRELTDEVSREAGIGPDCARQHGIDRSVWAEAAKREQADRIRSAYDDDEAPEDGASLDARMGDEFGRYEAAQERAAYEHEMRTQGV